MKKTWQAPRLVILVRSRPEEAILLVCKINGAQSSFSHLDNLECQWQGCSICHDQQAS